MISLRTLFFIILIATGIAIVGLSVGSRLFADFGGSGIAYKIIGIQNSLLFNAGLGLIAAAFASLVKDLALVGISNSQAFKQPRMHECALSLVSFSMISLCIFLVQRGALLNGVDGNFAVAIHHQQGLWMRDISYFGANFLQGAGGNIWVPINTKVDLGYLALGKSSDLQIAFAHTIWAVLLFSSTFILSRVVNLSVRTALLASWLAPILILYPGQLGFYRVAGLTPHVATAISVSNFILATLIWKPAGVTSVFARPVLLLALASYLFVANPTFTILILPIVLLVSLLKIISLSTTKDRFKEIIMLAAIFGILLSIGAIEFLIGLFLDTAVYMFPSEFVVGRVNIYFISTLTHGIGLPIIVVTIASFIGVLCARRVSTELRILISASMVLLATILTLGLLTVFAKNSWKGPSPLYFEFFLWPIYCIALSITVTGWLEKLGIKVNEAFSAGAGGSAYIGRVQYAFYCAPVLFCFAAFFSRPSERNQWIFPPPSGELVQSLADIVHAPGDKFKGRSATFFGLDISGPLDVHEPEMLSRFWAVLSGFNNEFQYAGLMQLAIPSLLEYNALLSPRFYFLSTRLFGRQGDRQIRNKVFLRELDLKLIGLFGVNNIITDGVVRGLNQKGSEEKGNLTLYNYRSNSVNLGDWSPIHVVVNPNPYDTVKILKSSDFDPKVSVVLDQSVGQKLEEAYDSSLVVGPNEYIVSAASNSFSLLLLPIEYSSCFEMIQNEPTELPPQIYVANQLFISVLFKKHLNITLRFRNGPFVNPACRLDDYLSFKKSLNSQRSFGE